ncbi:MAG TPA: F0F1 ATP synthase subunit A [Planctomycetaceae bacterium]|nr:F0F1 ATP synthase subunit A [Planctomycetaceae bacterium]
MAAAHSDDVFHHVRDNTVFEVPQFLGGEWSIPQPFGGHFPITKFMILEIIAAILVFVIFRTLAAKAASGEPVRGRFWNFWEAIAVFLRDDLVRPTIGESHDHHDSAGGHSTHVPKAGHPADKYLPFIWSAFFFILFCNILGAIPWLGSPTSHLWMTGALAVTTLFVVVRAGMSNVGPAAFWKLVPKSVMELPVVLAIFLIPLMWVIEFLGLMIKHGVLAVRLFANILAGHTVIAVILGFIGSAANSPLYYVVAPASVFGQVAIGLLELFVAFLQAYVFVFLATVFISVATHPH